MDTTDNAVWIMLWNLQILLQILVTDNVADIRNLHRVTRDTITGAK